MSHSVPRSPHADPLQGWTARFFRLDDSETTTRWPGLWEASPQRTPFATLPFARALCRALNLQCDVLLTERSGETEAGALVFWRFRGPFRVVVVPPLTQYTPLLLRAPLSEADVHRQRSPLDALLAALESRYHHLRFFCPALSDVRPASWRGWDTRPLYTYRLILDAHTTADWSESTRRTLRSQGGRFRVHEGARDAAAETVDLAAASYSRHDRALPLDRQTLRSLLDDLLRDGLVRLFTAVSEAEGRTEGALAVLLDGRTAHYWIAGSIPGAAMTVLLGHVLSRLREEGVRTFDFVGANTPSIAEFKRRFGPVLTPYVSLGFTPHPLLRLFYRIRGG